MEVKIEKSYKSEQFLSLATNLIVLRSAYIQALTNNEESLITVAMLDLPSSVSDIIGEIATHEPRTIANQMAFIMAVGIDYLTEHFGLNDKTECLKVLDAVDILARKRHSTPNKSHTPAGHGDGGNGR